MVSARHSVIISQMTEYTPRPESFPILQPPQTKYSCLPYVLLSGWPHQSFDSLLSSPLPWILLGGSPLTGLLESLLAVSLPQHVPVLAVADGLMALKQIWEGHYWLRNPRWFPAATAQSVNFLAGPLRPRITGPNLSAFAQPFLIPLILNQPTSLLTWPEFLLFSSMSFFMLLPKDALSPHLHWSFTEPSLIHTCPGKGVIPFPKLLYHLRHFSQIHHNAERMLTLE